MSTKLYTEEQVRKGLTTKNNILPIDLFLEKMTPIELPTDEEIEKTAISISDYYMNRVYFNMGVKYIINKIQGGNNG